MTWVKRVFSDEIIERISKTIDNFSFMLLSNGLLGPRQKELVVAVQTRSNIAAGMAMYAAVLY